ncbi:MAG: integration host factor subunit alpha [Rhodospirillaceae bacterium]|jgi:integration host factor subunit alpha|nr:integration host factor subunit alpha [Rhodospirillaceae bacterium]
MIKQTITRAKLSDAIYQEIGLSRKDSADLLDLVLHEILTVLMQESVVKIPSFGNFLIHYKNKRLGRNPKTGKEVSILHHNVIVFRPSKLLKKYINDQLYSDR